MKYEKICVPFNYVLKYNISARGIILGNNPFFLKKSFDTTRQFHGNFGTSLDKCRQFPDTFQTTSGQFYDRFRPILGLLHDCNQTIL